jgi:hypothetical protein
MDIWCYHVFTLRADTLGLPHAPRLDSVPYGPHARATLSQDHIRTANTRQDPAHAANTRLHVS